MKMSDLSQLSKALEEAGKNAQSISSTYLSLDSLKAGDVITAFHLAYKYEIEDKLDEKTGAITPTPKHTAMFLAFDGESFRIQVSSSKVLAETIGMFGLKPKTAIRITYLGRKGTANKKYGSWNVDVLPANLGEYEHLLPEHIKPILRMADAGNTSATVALMNESEVNGNAAIEYKQS